MSLIDRFRRENAVQQYDFWLDLRAVPMRRRRELRRELRANLTEASADVGMTRAPVSYTHLTLPTTPYV